MGWRSVGEVLGKVIEQAVDEFEKRESKLRRTSLKTNKLKERIDFNIWGTTPLGQVGARVGDTGSV